MSEKKQRTPSVETQAKLLRKRVAEVNGLIEALGARNVEVEIDINNDGSVALGELKIVKTF